MATKKDFEASIDEIGDLVDEALDPELSREQIVGKLKDIAEVLEGGGEEELGDEVEEDDEED